MLQLEYNLQRLFQALGGTPSIQDLRGMASSSTNWLQSPSFGFYVRISCSAVAVRGFVNFDPKDITLVEALSQSKLLCAFKNKVDPKETWVLIICRTFDLYNTRRS